MRWMTIALTAILVTVMPAGALAHEDKSGPKKVEAEGRIVAVDGLSGTIVVRGEKDRTWVILVDRATEIKFEEDDDDEEEFYPAGIRDLRVGDEVEVRGLRLGDNRIFALKIKVEGERPQVRVPSVGLVIRGVVVMISNKHVIVVTHDGNVTVVIQAKTRFTESGRRISLAELGRHDVVIVRGQRTGNAFLADEIEVEFDATDGVVLSGVIGVLWLQGGAFLLAGMPVWINVTSRTLIIRNQSSAPLNSLPPNGSVVVYGVGKGTAMQAMVVVIR